MEAVAAHVKNWDDKGDNRDFVLTFIMYELGVTEEAAFHLKRYLAFSDYQTASAEEEGALKRKKLLEFCPHLGKLIN